jgi:hypothetical protein
MTGTDEHERGMDTLQKWTIAGVVLFVVGAVLLRFAVERVVD